MNLIVLFVTVCREIFENLSMPCAIEHRVTLLPFIAKTSGALDEKTKELIEFLMEHDSGFVPTLFSFMKEMV